jgi:DNA-binding transcriptional LysR family regulator
LTVRRNRRRMELNHSVQNPRKYVVASAASGGMKQEMELRHVRSFIAVAEEGNFGRAAERLRIAQSAVSQQIKSLERSLGVTLFDRAARPIELTPAGERFLGHARAILESVDRAVDETTAAVTDRRSVLRFGMSSFGGGPVVDELVRLARERLTDVDLQVFLDTTLHNVAALNRGTLDVSITYIPFHAKRHLRFLRLGNIEYKIAVPAGHRLAAVTSIPREDLGDQPVLYMPRTINPLLADHVSWLLFGRADQPWLEVVDGLSRRLELVAEGAGITPVAFPIERLLPVPGVVYRPIAEPAPTLDYGLLWFDDRASAGLLAFLDLAREIEDRLSGASRSPLISA